MDLPPLRKGTAATVELLPQLGKDGGMVALVLIKQRFSIARNGYVGRMEGAKVQAADDPWDPKNPATSSVKYPSDVCLRKPSTDVVLVGSAVGQGRPKVKSLDVLVRVGPVEKMLRVFGLRVWFKWLTGLSLSPPQPFEEVELRWENAFGGYDASDPARPLEEPANPVGRGISRNPESLIHLPGPSIEDPANLITSHRTRPQPAGVGALGRHWAPRRAYAGTMDEGWKKKRMPLLPLDFDDRYNQVAPPGLIAPEYLKGGERVQLVNVCEDGPLQFRLPRLSFFVGLHTRAGLIEHRPVLDTVLLEPNQRRFDLTWRSAVPLPASQPPGSIQVHEKELRG